MKACYLLILLGVLPCPLSGVGSTLWQLSNLEFPGCVMLALIPLEYCCCFLVIALSVSPPPPPPPEELSHLPTCLAKPLELLQGVICINNTIFLSI